jgi:branched-chain amino acid transport system ATP-binding protein
VRELLRVEKLRKSFHDLAAVDAIDLQLAVGVLVALIGPNGAGKTTLINLLSGALAPDAGRVIFRGEDITRLPSHLRVRRGVTRSYQVMNIFPRLTVHENVLLPVLARQRRLLRFFSPTSAYTAAVEEADHLLAEVGLSEQRGQAAGQLSHGDQRRLELGIAVAVQPVLCLLDEPSAGMNPVERTIVLELVKKLAHDRQTTFVIVEHDMDVVFSLAERIVVMNRGRILADGTPREIRENRQVRETYLGEEWGG